MDKQQTFQFIAEHLDPMDTAGGWGSGEAFADAILEYADGELPVTRDDLIEYWRQARRKAEASRLERTPLQVRVEYGPRSNRGTAIVTLNGFTMADRLTPKLARAALRAVGATAGEVWTLAQPDPETGELRHRDVYGYRVYARSARKLSASTGPWA